MSESRIQRFLMKSAVFTSIAIGLIGSSITVQAQTKRPEYSPDVLLVAKKTKLADPQFDAALRKLGGQVIQTFPALKLSVVKLPASLSVEKALILLQKNPSIAYAHPNYRITAAETTPSDTFFGFQYGFKNTGTNLDAFEITSTPGADISATKAWDLWQGSDTQTIVVGDIDSGIDYFHPDLAENIWVNPDIDAPDVIGVNFTDGTGEVTSFDPYDDDGHGTHTAGTIGARGNNEMGVTGVNWKVKILPVKFLDSTGSGYTVDAVAAINYLTYQKYLYLLTGGAKGANIVAVNDSWGGSRFSQALYDAIKLAGDYGIVHCCASGNNGTNNDTTYYFPANLSFEVATQANGGNHALANVISVGATDTDDKLASFSNFGKQSVSITAPGYLILSTVPLWYVDEGLSVVPYDFFSGTSMAAPHVTGAVGLLASYLESQGKSQLSIADLRDRLLTSGDPLLAIRKKTTSGRRLNAYNLLTNTRTVLPDLPKLTLLHTVTQTTNRITIDFLSKKPNNSPLRGALLRIVVTNPNGSKLSGNRRTNMLGIGTFWIPNRGKGVYTIQVSVDTDEYADYSETFTYTIP